MIFLTGVLLVRGIGLGAAMIPLGGAGFAGLEQGEIPHASILVRVTQQLGGSLGTAILLVILQHATAGAHSPESLITGFQQAFWWSVVFTAIAVPVCLALPGRPELPRAEPRSAPAERDQVPDHA